MLYECILEITYRNPTKFSLFSKSFPKANINYWCNTKIDVIIINGDWNKERVVTYLNSVFDGVKVLSEPNTSSPLILKICECTFHPIDPIINKFD